MCALKKPHCNSLGKRRKEAELVYFEDRGSVLDARIDAVWDFILEDADYHPKAHHNSLHDVKWKPERGDRRRHE